MVTTAVFDEAAEWPVRPVTEVLPSRPSQCARCGSRMFMGRDEPECVTCGYADYTYSRDMAPRWARNSILSSATRLVARYVGASERLAHTVVHMTLVRKGTRAIYKVTCPFCQGSMEESSLSGKRAEPQEQRFKCGDGHRVSIMPGRNGMPVWA